MAGHSLIHCWSHTPRGGHVMASIALILAASAEALGQSQTTSQSDAAASTQPTQMFDDEADFPMPARDRYMEIQRALGDIHGHSEEEKAERTRLIEERSEAEEAMRAEVKRLNELIFGQRQEELRKRAPAAVTQGRALGFGVLNYPRVDGSTSAHPLGVLLACRLLGANYEWTNLGPSAGPLAPYPGLFVLRGSYTPSSYFVQYAIQARTEPPSAARRGRIINELIVVHNGTHVAYENVIKGNADFALTARRPSESELKLAAERDVTLDAQPVALDAFVFIVNRDNPVRSLSTEQLINIFTHDITNWSAVGGDDKPITTFRRNRDSGSEELFRDVFLKGRRLDDIEAATRRELIASGMMGPYHQLTENERGIGYSVYYYEHFMSASPYTRTLAVAGVRPTSDTIRSGEYPYVTKVYAVIRKDTPTDAPARRLRDWLLSPEGQAVVEESGYVPLPAE